MRRRRSGHNVAERRGALGVLVLGWLAMVVVVGTSSTCSVLQGGGDGWRLSCRLTPPLPSSSAITCVSGIRNAAGAALLVAASVDGLLHVWSRSVGSGGGATASVCSLPVMTRHPLVFSFPILRYTRIHLHPYRITRTHAPSHTQPLPHPMHARWTGVAPRLICPHSLHRSVPVYLDECWC